MATIGTSTLFRYGDADVLAPDFGDVGPGGASAGGGVVAPPVVVGPVDESAAIAAGWRRYYDYADVNGGRLAEYYDPANPSNRISYSTVAGTALASPPVGKLWPDPSAPPPVESPPPAPIGHGDPRTEADAIAYGYKLVETTDETVSIGTGQIVHYTSKHYVDPATGASFFATDEQARVADAMAPFYEIEASSAPVTSPFAYSAVDVPPGLASWAAAHGLAIPDSAVEALAAGWAGGTVGPAPEHGRDGKTWTKTIYVEWPGQPAPRDALLVNDDRPSESTGTAVVSTHTPTPPTPKAAAKSPFAAIIAGAIAGFAVGGPPGAVVGGVVGAVASKGGKP